MLNIFKKYKINDPELGHLIFEKPFWTVKYMVAGQTVALNIDGNKNILNPFAKSYWLKINENIDVLWDATIKFTLSELPKIGFPFTPTYNDFTLDTISVYEKNSFDGGHLAFWFEIKQDETGWYYVSFRNEKPFFLHRDN